MIIILSYIFYSIAASVSPLQRRWLAKNKGGASRNQIDFTFKVTLVVVALSTLIPLLSPLRFSGNPYYLFILTLACGVCGAVAVTAIYMAQKHVESGVSSLISNIYTPVAIVFASLFLKEGLTPPQILGTTLLLVAMVIVSKKHRVGLFHFDKYFILMIAGGIMLGLYLTAERTLIKTTGFAAGTMLSWWSQCAVLGIATYITRSKHTYSRKDILITGVSRFFNHSPG
jgi:drug/metabolite transporter (DMT)-like permease